MSEDPLKDVDSPNLYAFVGWQPNARIDPTGEGWGEVWAFTKSAGVVVGTTVLVVGGAALAGASAPLIIVGGIVVGGGMAVKSGIDRYSHALDIEEDPSLSQSMALGLGDVVGATQLVEATSGLDLQTGRQLTSEERASRLGTTTGVAVSFVVAPRVYRAGSTFRSGPGVPPTSTPKINVVGPRSQGAPIDVAPVPRVAPYGAMKGTLAAGEQANHLNQNAAFKSIIPESEGAANAMRGNAFTEIGSAHYRFHAVLERFWQPYRKGGALFGEKPTNAEYEAALISSLRESGYTEAAVASLAAAARQNRAAYGLSETHLVPKVPGRLPQKRAE